MHGKHYVDFQQEWILRSTWWSIRASGKGSLLPLLALTNMNSTRYGTKSLLLRLRFGIHCIFVNKELCFELSLVWCMTWWWTKSRTTRLQNSKFLMLALVELLVTSRPWRLKKVTAIYIVMMVLLCTQWYSSIIRPCKKNQQIYACKGNLDASDISW